jgi:hypothetical protein
VAVVDSVPVVVSGAVVVGWLGSVDGALSSPPPQAARMDAARPTARILVKLITLIVSRLLRRLAP